MDHFLLVDGHNLLFRMFYGMPDHFRTRSGARYNAVYGFANAMAAVTDALRMVTVTMEATRNISSA